MRGNINIKRITKLIRQKSIDIGFSAVGISRAEKLDGFDRLLNRWLGAGYHSNMHYMEKNRDKRADPTLLVGGAKSVISLLTNYYPARVQDEDVPQIAKYAYGIDYHFVLKERMQLLWDYIFGYFPGLDGRMFVDSAPVADKHLASRSGLGWIGKNGCLINKNFGSFVFVSELIINVELGYDEPVQSNFCGSCTRCIDSCPTKAIVEPGVIDSNRCISYQTIENRTDTIPDEFAGKFSNRVFGCDICQDACPWNKNPPITQIEEFKPNPKLYSLGLKEWERMQKTEFNELFRISALKRAKFTGLKRNIYFLSKKV